MGFVKETYSNHQGGLVVAFLGESNSDNYFAGNSIQDALEYFNMYVENNQIYIKTDEERALNEIGVISIEEAEILRQEIDAITSNMTDEQAVEHPMLFSTWVVGKAYVIGDRVRYNGKIFKVLQAHTSQADWTPANAPSLFAEILTSEDGTPQEWVQPDSTNPYNTGDRVIYDGHIYESTIDNNVWAPDVYGWILID